MNRLCFIGIFFGLTFHINLVAQPEFDSEEATNQFLQLNKDYTDTISKHGYDFETFANFYFKKLDLIPYLDDQKKVLDFLHGIGYTMHTLDLPDQTLHIYNLYFHYYKRFEKELDQEYVDLNIRRRSFNYGMMAEAYLKLGKVDSAEIVHKNNIKFIKPLNSVFYASALNNYGLFLTAEISDYDLAFENFSLAKSIVIDDKESKHFLGSIVDNLADVYRTNGNYQKALDLYFENFNRYGQINHPNSKSLDLKRLVSAGCQAIDMAVKLGREEVYKTIKSQLDDYVYSNQSWMLENPESKLEYLKVDAILASKQNDYKKAYNYSVRIKALSDSIKTINNDLVKQKAGYLNNLTLERIRSKFTLEKSQKENKIIAQRQNIWIISLVGILGLTTMSFLLYRRKKKNILATNEKLLAEKNMELTVLKNVQLKSEINAKKKDLSDFAINLIHHQEWAKELDQQMQVLKSSKGRQRSKLLSIMEEEIKGKINFDTNTQDFYERLDKLSASFYQQLNSNFEHLSKTERRLCSLIRLNIDSHEIANLQNISLASLNTARYRLRKKLNLDEDQHLDEFIQSL